MESGTYDMVENGSTGVKAFHIPAKDKPNKDFFKDSKRLTHLKSQIIRSKKLLLMHNKNIIPEHNDDGDISELELLNKNLEYLSVDKLSSKFSKSKLFSQRSNNNYIFESRNDNNIKKYTDDDDDNEDDDATKKRDISSFLGYKSTNGYTYSDKKRRPLSAAASLPSGVVSSYSKPFITSNACNTNDKNKSNSINNHFPSLKQQYNHTNKIKRPSSAYAHYKPNQNKINSFDQKQNYLYEENLVDIIHDDNDSEGYEIENDIENIIHENNIKDETISNTEACLFKATKRFNIDLTLNIDDLDIQELKMQLKALKKFVKEDYPRIVEEKMLTELKEHPTVEYIKSLEIDRIHYKNKLALQVKKYNDLRIAFNAKQLQMKRFIYTYILMYSCIFTLLYIK